MNPHSYPSGFGLALPTTSAASSYASGSTSFQSSPGPSNPSAGAGGPKKIKGPRKPKIRGSISGNIAKKGGLDLERALDENDDIDEERDLIAGPTRRERRGREVDEDYDEDEGSDGEGDGDADGDDGEDGEADQDAPGEPDGEGSGKGAKQGDGGGDKGKGKAKAKQEVVDMRESLKRRRERLGEVEVDGQEMESRNMKRRKEANVLREQMDAEQARRFDAFQTAVLPKQAVKKLNREMFDQSCNTNLAAILAGLGKVFVAEVIEIAKDLQPTSSYPTGPLRPYHLRLARMELERRGLLSSNGSSGAGSALRPKKAIFRR